MFATGFSNRIPSFSLGNSSNIYDNFRRGMEMTTNTGDFVRLSIPTQRKNKEDNNCRYFVGLSNLTQRIRMATIAGDFLSYC